jgi:hypothetical protein
MSDKDLSIPGVGIVESGEIVELPESFHNANFQLVETQKSKKEKVELDEENINKE